MTLLEQTDRALSQAANHFAGRSIVFDTMVRDMLNTALPNGGLVVAAFCWLWFETDRLGSHPERRNVTTAVLAVMIVVAALWLLKAFLPFRHRPLDDVDLALRVPFDVDPASANALSAFPSGHTAFFLALTVPLWWRSRWLGAAAAVWVFLTICLPLLYRGDHWPSDIIAGAAVGVALMLLLCRFVGGTALPDRVLAFSQRHPPAFYAIAWLLALEIALFFRDIKTWLADAAGLARGLYS
ncbi:MAG TPA: phosphatase PAP2 family protein [Reyranella sp.]|jgi:undecaprenyl-diphosphatase